MQFDSYTQKELKSGFELLWEKKLKCLYRLTKLYTPIWVGKYLDLGRMCKGKMV